MPQGIHAQRPQKEAVAELVRNTASNTNVTPLARVTNVTQSVKGPDDKTMMASVTE